MSGTSHNLSMPKRLPHLQLENKCASQCLKNPLLWNVIEKHLKVAIPIYLKNLLEINGYDNHHSIKDLCKTEIQEIEQFAKNELILMKTDVELQPLPDYYGIYWRCPKQFKITLGHKILLYFIRRLAQEKGDDLLVPSVNHDIIMETIYQKNILFWDVIEEHLKVSIPMYLKNLLELNGYDNHLSMKYLDERRIQEIEKFARNELALVKTDLELQPLPAYYGIYGTCPKQFKILSGDRKLLCLISKLATEEEDLFAPSVCHDITMRANHY